MTLEYWLNERILGRLSAVQSGILTLSLSFSICEAGIITGPTLLMTVSNKRGKRVRACHCVWPHSKHELLLLLQPR